MLFVGASAKMYESPLFAGGLYLRIWAMEMPGLEGISLFLRWDKDQQNVAGVTHQRGMRCPGGS